MVKIHRKANKQLSKLPRKVIAMMELLVDDLTHYGPRPSKHWPNYSKLKGSKSEDKRHCHLSKGSPTYVACWIVKDKHMRLIEVYYVGTHEKAPY